MSKVDKLTSEFAQLTARLNDAIKHHAECVDAERNALREVRRLTTEREDARQAFMKEVARLHKRKKGHDRV